MRKKLLLLRFLSLKKISSKVELAHRAPEGVKVKYSSTCQDIKGKINSTNECTQIKPGTEVEFAVTITVSHV